MARREASINDVKIDELQRNYFGLRPESEYGQDIPLWYPRGPRQQTTIGRPQSPGRSLMGKHSQHRLDNQLVAVFDGSCPASSWRIASTPKLAKASPPQRKHKADHAHSHG
jgi:hypothetical protein